MTYTHYHVGDYIGLPAEPPVGTVLQARVMQDGTETGRFRIRRGAAGWHITGTRGAQPVPWRAALDAWGPGSPAGWAFEVVKLPKPS